MTPDSVVKAAEELSRTLSLSPSPHTLKVYIDSYADGISSLSLQAIIHCFLLPG